MSQTGKLIEQQQAHALWDGVRQFAMLPGWLATARDTARIGQELAAAVPEFRNGQWELMGCDAGHVRYKHQFWTALYQMVVRRVGEQTETIILLQGRIFPPGSPEVSAVRVEGSLGAADWIAILPALNLELRAREAEVVLAALDYLTDPEQSRVFLEKSIRAGTPALGDLEIAACAPKVVRYKPGSRCTVVYRLGYAPGMAQQKGWPELVVTKTYRGEKGKNAYDSMAAIWEAGLKDVVKVSQPLAYLPDEKVLVQGPVPEEQTLKDMIFATMAAPTPEAAREIRAQLDRYMRKTASGLAALHNAAINLGRNWDWQDEMNEVVSQVDRLAEVLPELKAAAAPLLDRLNQMAASIPADPRIPAHGSFRPAQVLIHSGEIGFIDFDSFCQSEPSNDLALFLGTVMSMALTPEDIDEETAQVNGQDQFGAAVSSSINQMNRQERYNFAAALSNTFLDAYAQDHPVTRQRVALWEALDIFMFVLHGWTKVKVGEIDDIIFLLDQFLIDNGIAP